MADRHPSSSLESRELRLFFQNHLGRKAPHMKPENQDEESRWFDNYE
jgi:hypothetical protein